MQFQGQGKPPVGIVFDSDLGNTIDDALALAMLYGLQGKGDSRVLSVSITKSSLKAAIFGDVLVRFYTGEPGGFGGGPTPIGMALSGKMPEDTQLITAAIAKMTPEGKPAYGRSVEKLNDTADPVAVIRNAMSAQFEQNCIVVLTGPATNLAKLLEFPSSKALITQKVRYLVVGSGNFAGGPPDPQIRSDIAAAKKLFAEWPTPIVASGSEVGESLPFPGASLEKDFAWSQAHPIVDAYRAYHPMPYDADSGAMTAALYAVRPQEGYFKLSEPGTIAVLDDGRTRFTASTEGKHRYLIVDPAQKERIVQVYTETASTKPVGRVQRFRPPQKKQELL
jgi:hypothetical protein